MEGASVIRHGVLGKRREHRSQLLMIHVKLILEHPVSNLCLDHK